MRWNWDESVKAWREPRRKTHEGRGFETEFSIPRHLGSVCLGDYENLRRDKVMGGIQ